MAGIYLHIPFCKSRCKYCDFFSTTLLEKQERYVDALLQELELRSQYLPDNQIETIYFGGGTPSLLSNEAIQRILAQIHALYNVTENAEITLEANPCDLTAQKTETLRQTGINRLSIGIQSFHPRLLQLMGRRHTAQEARDAVRQAQQHGFDNISIDLIYALPTQTLQEWEEDVQTAMTLNIQHVSTYCLSYESSTPFAQMLQNGLLTPIEDETANSMYESAVGTLQANGFAQYEISNFAKTGFYSRHNSSYWNNTPYIGIGAAAHSYDGQSRQWNIADVQAYTDGVQARNLHYEKEVLTDNDKYNERIMLSLRTANGLDLDSLPEQEAAYCLQQAKHDIDRGLLRLQNNRLTASLQGIELLNRVIENLIIG